MSQVHKALLSPNMCLIKKVAHYQSKAELKRAFIKQLEMQTYEYLPIISLDVHSIFDEDWQKFIEEKKIEELKKY